MLYKFHYFCLAAGANALLLLLGVYLAEYTGASATELGFVYMLMPFVGLIFKPIICSYADRKQAHRKVLILCQLSTALSFLPFVIIPYLGPNIYKVHSRSCWIILVGSNILGDIAVCGTNSIGDSLTVNYAKRIGTDFGTYRFWDAVSWVIFGLTTGHLNEASFLPKYVAAFMVLILVALLDAFVCFIWPKEYFEMTTASELQRDRAEEPAGGVSSWFSAQTKCLMPKGVVWAHAKKQIWSLVSIRSCFARSETVRGPNGGTNIESKQMAPVGVLEERQLKCEDQSISKRVQFQTLLLLIRRDSRILFYSILFVPAGALAMSARYFILSLSDRCHTQNTCNFSQLAGYMQFAMGVLEPVLFSYMNNITQLIGRLNTLTICFGLGSLKFLFYATIWSNVNPHWALVAELVDGAFYVIFLTTLVEMSHFFASEVEYLIPELVERKVIASDDEISCERLKRALPATMLALLAGAYDGLGKGFGALVYGLIIDAYSFETLWRIIAFGSFCTMAGLQFAQMSERCFSLKFGFDQRSQSKSAKSETKLTEA